MVQLSKSQMYALSLASLCLLSSCGKKDNNNNRGGPNGGPNGG